MFRRSVVLAFALSLLLVPMSAIAQEADAQITIVHAALYDPEEVTEVDVYVIEGDDPFVPAEPRELLRIDEFFGGDAFGPVSLDAGEYRVVITVAGDPADDLYDEVIEVPAGLEASLVAQFDPEGGDGLIVNVHIDDLSPTACDEARVVFRHAAIEGPVDIWVDGSPAAEAVTNGEQLLTERPAGTYDVLVTGAGEVDDVLFEGEVELVAGEFTAVYAASLFDDNDEFVVVFDDFLEVGEEECPVEDDDEEDPVDEGEPVEEEVEDEGEEMPQPTRVQSGTGGLVGGLPVQVLLLALLGLALVSAPVVAAARRR